MDKKNNAPFSIANCNLGLKWQYVDKEGKKGEKHSRSEMPVDFLVEKNKTYFICNKEKLSINSLEELDGITQALNDPNLVYQIEYLFHTNQHEIVENAGFYEKLLKVIIFAIEKELTYISSPSFSNQTDIYRSIDILRKNKNLAERLLNKITSLKNIKDTNTEQPQGPQ